MENNMNLLDYQNYVEKLASQQSTSTEKDRLLLSVLGLNGEAGECADLVKKHIYHGKPLDKNSLILEAGDVMWYMAFLCNTLGVTIQEVVDKNVEKLQDRYKTGKFNYDEFMKKENAKSTDS